MAITLGKLTIIVGAGFLGSVRAQDGGPSKVSDLFSGASKVVFKHLHHDDSPPKSKPQNDSLMVQVNSLRAELQQFATSRSVTVITTNSRSGARAYAMPILVAGVVGYGYIWWKGWKLSDLIFATRHSFVDACTTIGKQLDQVSSSLSAAKRHLSSRIDRVDANLDECTALTAATKDEVSLLRGDLSNFTVDIESVHRAVQCLETKIGRIEEKQDVTNEGVYQLCVFAQRLEAEATQASLLGSSRPTLELSPVVSSTPRTLSLPSTTLAIEPASTSEETPKALQPLQYASSAFGLKDLQDISDSTSMSEMEVTSGGSVPEPRSNTSSSSPSSSTRSGWKLPGFSAAFLTRKYSATYSFR